MKKQIMVLIVLAVLFTAFLACSAHADLAYGTQLDCTWRLLETGTLIISNRYTYYTGLYLIDGQLMELSTGGEVSACSWGGYSDYIYSIIVQEGITKIGADAFRGLKNVRSVKLPSTLETIEEGAFCFCGMESITIPEKAHRVHCGAFGQNKNLKTIYVYPALKNNQPTFIGEYGTWPYYDLFDRDYIEQNHIDIYVLGTREESEGIERIVGSSLRDYVTWHYELPWNLDDNGVLTISGSGAMVDYSSSYPVPWGSEKSRIVSVVLEDGITSIGDCTFSGCINLKSVTIPEGVTSIGSSAFSSCSNLTDITIPESVNSIGSNAFFGCISLNSITIPESVTSIGTNAFSSCNGLITAGPIGSDCNYQFGWTEAIPDNAFRACSSLKSVTIPDGVKSIGSEAFRNCTDLTNISIPNSVISLGDNPFSGCEKLKSAGPIGSESDYQFGWIEVIPDNAFSYSNLSEVTIPGSIQNIGDKAFYRCYYLTDVYFKGTQEQWDSIGLGEGNEQLSNAEIHFIESEPHHISFTDISNGTVTADKENAVEGEKITLTVIPEWEHGLTALSVSYVDSKGTVRSIAVTQSEEDPTKYTFYMPATDIIISAEFSEEALSWVSENSVAWAISNGVLYISGSGTMTDFQNLSDTRGWRSSLDEITTVVVKDGVERIGNFAFSGCGNLSRVILPESLRSIGDNAFLYCSNLTEIILPDGLEAIDNYAFDSCYNLSGITIPASVTSIGSYAFYCCENLCNITVLGSPVFGGYVFGGSDNLESAGPIGGGYNFEFAWTEDIPAHAFDCCDINSIIIPETVTSIGDSAFSNCTNLTAVDLPDGLTSVGKHAFYNCLSLTEIIIPGNVAGIDNYTFDDCINLISITVPDSVSFIGSYAFDNCRALKEVTFSGNLVSIGENAFRNCSSLEEIFIFGSIDTIESGSFSGCSALTSVFMQEGIKHIGSYAFSGCKNLTSVSIPEGVLTIETGAFGNCTNLAEITLPYSIQRIIFGFTGCNNLTDVYYGGTAVQWKEVEKQYYASDGLLNAVFHYAHAFSVVSEPSENGTVTADKTAAGWRETVTLTVAPTAGFELETLSAVYTDDEGRTQNIIPVQDSENELKFSFSMPGADVSIAATFRPGYWGSVRWRIENGLLTIYGTGEIDNFTYEDTASAWHVYSANITSVEIEEGITRIGNYAFYNCGSIKNVTIPDGVTSIGNAAFNNCSELENVTIPTGVTLIGSSAFYNCTALTGVSIPDSVTALGSSVFYGCSSITDVSIPSGVTSIGSSAFQNCSALEDIVIPDTVTYIGQSAFYNCSSLSNVYYGGSMVGWMLISVGSNNTCLDYVDFYYGCDYITRTWDNLSWTMYDNGRLVISGSGAMADFTLNSKDAWRKVKTMIQTIEIESGVTSISSYAFSGCTALTDLILPESIKTIGDYAFNGCSAITEITLPDGVEILGVWSFGWNEALTTITIPCSVTNIKDYAFGRCSSLADVYYQGSETGWAVTTIGSNNDCLNAAEIHYCYDYIAGTWNNLNWILYEDGRLVISGNGQMDDIGTSGSNAWRRAKQYIREVEIEAGITSVSYGAFYNCSGIVSVSIPNSVTVIGNGAFGGCTALQSISIPDSVTDIESGAFWKTGLTSINIPDGVTLINGNTFANCYDLARIRIPSGVTSIGEYAFSGCSSLTDVLYTGKAVKWLSVSIGRYNDPLKNATMHYITPDFILPAALSVVEEEAFEGGAFKFVELSDNTVSVGPRAFADCSRLTSIYIPSASTEIDLQAFGDKQNLTIYGKSGSNAETFAQTKGFTFIEIP